MHHTGKKSTATVWHHASGAQVLEYLETSESGLGPSSADSRLEVYGLNALPQVARRNPLARFFLHFHNVLISVLIGSAVITALLNHWVDTGVILAVIITNAVIGFIQEGKAEQAMEAIRHLLAPSANVIRGGERVAVDGTRLVPGDVVLLEAGDKVPADLRLLSAHGLSMQEALLTGESVPVEKNVAPVAENASLGDRTCLAFSGTLVVSGQGKGVVVATGVNTEIGRISDLILEVETLTSPLVEQMGVFARWLTVMILIIAVAVLAFGYFVAHYAFTEMFMAVVGLSVAAIPEGLPAVLTITLAIGVQAMARRNVIVRRLPAIETLGSVSVICTDKTGTLTRNEMMVVSVVTHQCLFTIDGKGYEPKCILKHNAVHQVPADHLVLEELARAATLCNDAALREHDGVWGVEGDPMEGALLAFSEKVDVPIWKEKAMWTRTDAIPFDAKNRFMATLNHDHNDHACIFVKGAPERLLALCQDQRNAHGAEEPLNRAYWNEQAEATAAAIGRHIGLMNTETVLTGKDIDDLENTALSQAVLECDVFARTSPEHKLRLVMALQSQGMTVAMTGDGVNDASALKRADAGIAMGKNGSEAAKEAAELVLLDDNFSSIVAAVREGRTVYDNLKKVISWTLPTNAGEAMTIVVALLLGMTLPITPIQILWINLITAITLGLALAFEPSEKNIMCRPPRARNEPLLSGELVWHVVLVSMLFVCGVFGTFHYAIDRGYSVELARTIALNTLLVMEVFQLFFIRSIHSTSLRNEHKIKSGSDYC